MRKKISIWTAFILAADLLLGTGGAAVGIGPSAVHAAATEFGMTVSPSAGESAVDTSRSLWLTFAETVTPQLNKNITISTTGEDDEDIITSNIPVIGPGLIGSSSAYEIRLTGGQALLPNKTYTVEVEQGAFKNSANAESALTNWSFRTKPEVVNIPASFSPANNARVEAANVTSLSLTLDDVLSKGGGSIKLMSAANNTVVREFTMLDSDSAVELTDNGVTTTVILTLGSTHLLPSTSYYVLIDSYALKKTNNQAFIGISSGSTWSFTTKGAGAITAALSPANGTTGVSITGALQMVFDRPVIPGTGDIIVSPGAQNDARARRINVTSSAVTGGGGRTITITPASASSPLLGGTTYNVTVPAGAFADLDGNTYAGTSVWSFTTASSTSALTMTSLSPADRSESVAVNSSITITFNREVRIDTPSGIALYKSNGTQVSASVQSVSSNKRNISITPVSSAGLEYDTTYYVNIASGAIADLNDPLVKYSGLSGASSWSFKTISLDRTAPVLSTATLENNRTIRLKYNEALKSSITLMTSSFPVTVNDEYRALDSAYISGDSVYITLSTGVAVGQVVKVSYTGGLRTIQDASGNTASTFTLRTVTGGDGSGLFAPKEGYLSGTSLTLTFNDSLKSASTYAYNQFTVTADGYSLGTYSISSSGNTVYLRLNNTPSNGQSIAVSYSPGSYPLQDLSSQNIPAFTNFYVRNYNDTIAPVLSGATGTGNKVTLTYNEGLSTTSLPTKSQFSVLSGTTAVYVTDVAVSGNQAVLTLTNSLYLDAKVTVSYVPGAYGLSDLNGNRAAYINQQPVTMSSGTTVSEISSAGITGADLSIVFNKAMVSSSALSTSQFTVRADGSAVNVQQVTLSGNSLKITLSSPVRNGQIIDLSYTPGSNPIKDSYGTAMAAFSRLPVTNTTSAATTTTRPTYLGTLSGTEFGQELPLLQSASAVITNDFSAYNQPVKRYALKEDNLAASYEFLYKQGGTAVAFEVPSTEKAAFVAVPMKPLLEAVNRSGNSRFVIRYGDHLYTIPLAKLDYNGLAQKLLSDNNNISLIFRMEKVPAGTYATLESKLQSNGMQGITGLMEYRLTAIVTGNTSRSEIVNIPGTYAVRTMAALNTSQTSAARMDLIYTDAVYLPTKINKSGSYSVIEAATEGNQIVGTYQSSRTFTDMGKHWSRTAVAELLSKNIIDKNYGTQFKPDLNITRSEFAVMLSRGLGLQGSSETAQKFTDMLSTSATQNGSYIGAAAKAGIINGNTDGTFGPGKNITREQMAIMMVRAMEYTSHPVTLNGTAASGLATFKDKAKIQNTDLVAKAVQAGIIQGISVGVFQPQGNATRAQAAVMLQRMLSKVDYL